MWAYKVRPHPKDRIFTATLSGSFWVPLAAASVGSPAHSRHGQGMITIGITSLIRVFCVGMVLQDREQLAMAED